MTSLPASPAPPSIQVPTEDLCVEPGQAATFTAIITGRPTPDIQWYKVGRALHTLIPNIYPFNNRAICWIGWIAFPALLLLYTSPLL